MIGSLMGTKLKVATRVQSCSKKWQHCLKTLGLTAFLFTSVGVCLWSKKGHYTKSKMSLHIIFYKKKKWRKVLVWWINFFLRAIWLLLEAFFHVGRKWPFYEVKVGYYTKSKFWLINQKSYEVNFCSGGATRIIKWSLFFCRTSSSTRRGSPGPPPPSRGRSP